MIYMISRFILLVIVRLFFRLKIFGRDNLPDKGPYIVACNHASYLDPPILGAAMPRSARFLIQENLYKKGFIGWWSRSIGCVRVKRQTRDISALKEALRRLNKGRILGLFPEGTRSSDGNLKEAQAGIGFLSFKAKAPIIPAYVKGTREALPKHSRTIKLKPLSIYLGEKIEPSSFSKGEGNKELYVKITKEVMSRIAQLKEKYG